MKVALVVLGDRIMASAFECDRCGKYYTVDKNTIVGFTDKASGENKDYDFCEDCIYWLKKSIKKETKRAE